MANPSNTVILYGVISGEIKFIKSKGTDFACRFTVAVTRNFRNKDGKYDKDFIPVKYTFDSDGREEFARSLKPGDGVMVTGCNRCDSWTKGEEQQQLLYVLAESVSYDRQTMAIKYPSQDPQQEEETGENGVFSFELDLP